MVFHGLFPLEPFLLSVESLFPVCLCTIGFIFWAALVQSGANTYPIWQCTYMFCFFKEKCLTFLLGAFVYGVMIACLRDSVPQ